MTERPPWLAGLIAVAHDVEAEAVRDALKARGLAVRSIPSGGADAAWNGVGPGDNIVGVVLSGGAVPTVRKAATYWAASARALVALGSGPGTGLVSMPALLLDGDATLAARARAALAPGAPAAVGGRVGSVEALPASPAARASLAAAGLAAVDTATETWREAGRLLGLPVLAVHSLRPDPALPPRLARLEPAGATRRDRWRTALALVRRPGDGALLREADAARLDAVRVAARCAVAACLGAP